MNNDVRPCPWCNTKKHVYPHGNRDFWCKQCGRLFDGEPEEGGDYADDPTRRIELEEAREAARRERLKGFLQRMGR